MSSVVRFVVLAVAAAFCGVYGALVLVDGRYGVIGQQVGVWKTWPTAGTASMDPYTRAHIISARRLPLSRFETLEFETANSSNGKPIESDCVYQIAGQIPPVRRWSLSSYNVEDDENIVPSPNSTLTSAQAGYLETDGISITLSSQPVSGNWLQPNGSGEQKLVLRLFDPAQIASRQTIAGNLLSIERTVCR